MCVGGEGVSYYLIILQILQIILQQAKNVKVSLKDKRPLLTLTEYTYMYTLPGKIIYSYKGKGIIFHKNILYI